MGILFTPESHRRKGHARKCILGLSHKLISLGLTPFVYIEDHNSSSRKLFSSLGFEMSHRASWIGYVPNKLSKDGGKKGCCH